MNEQSFLQALHADPLDEVGWLALADWLEENGQTDRADLLRLTRELHALEAFKHTRQRVALEVRLFALLASGVRPVVPEITNSIGMRLALIPPGRFRMGAPAKEKNRGNHEMAHEVEITRPFYLGVFHVTVAQYRAITGVDRETARRPDDEDEAEENADQLPVNYVSWDDAQKFCTKLTEREANARPDWKYRLPTEAEWEYACRAYTMTAYNFGSKITHEKANYDGSKGLGRRCAVGSYLPNAFGLYDMHGNAWEWVRDFIGWDYYGISPEVDPQGPTDGSGRVVRGGGWGSSGGDCRSAARSWNPSGNRNQWLGFRVALARE